MRLKVEDGETNEPIAGAGCFQAGDWLGWTNAQGVLRKDFSDDPAFVGAPGFKMREIVGVQPNAPDDTFCMSLDADGSPKILGIRIFVANAWNDALLDKCTIMGDYKGIEPVRIGATPAFQTEDLQNYDESEWEGILEEVETRAMLQWAPASNFCDKPITLSATREFYRSNTTDEMVIYPWDNFEIVIYLEPQVGLEEDDDRLYPPGGVPVHEPVESRVILQVFTQPATEITVTGRETKTQVSGEGKVHVQGYVYPSAVPVADFELYPGEYTVSVKTPEGFQPIPDRSVSIPEDPTNLYTGTRFTFLSIKHKPKPEDKSDTKWMDGAIVFGLFLVLGLIALGFISSTGGD